MTMYQAKKKHIYTQELNFFRNFFVLLSILFSYYPGSMHRWKWMHGLYDWHTQLKVSTWDIATMITKKNRIFLSFGTQLWLSISFLLFQLLLFIKWAGYWSHIQRINQWSRKKTLVSELRCIHAVVVAMMSMTNV